VQQGVAVAAISKEEGWREVLHGRFKRRCCVANMSCNDSKLRREGRKKEIRDKQG
jgi:hypothetical protein